MKPEHDVDNLQELQKGQRRLKAIVLLLGLVLGGVLWTGLAAQPLPSPRIVTRELVLEDSEGRIRARMSTRNGDPRIEFYDSSGRVLWFAPARPELMPVK